MKSTEYIMFLLLALLCFNWSCDVHGETEFDYRDALSKSIMFLEAQRSGKLPPNQRIKWRGDSALTDGYMQKVDLVGGYYDAGDNVKYGLPMAFTITLLSWSTIQYERELKSAGEIENVRTAIKWGTDYFLKASNTANQLWVQVGDPVADHECWQQPEVMSTPRTVYKIDMHNPGTEVAAETAAALAASSIVFRGIDTPYSLRLLHRAQLLFSYADTYRGSYSGACPFYCSFSGYKDELLWAASWLYVATKSKQYSDYIQRNTENVIVNEFSWDLKYAGVQVLLSTIEDSQFVRYRSQAEGFICSILPNGPSSSVFITPGGLMYVREGANTQYVTSASLLISIYSDLLSAKKQTLLCGDHQFKANDVMAFAKQQVDYLLGKNPLGMSYMVGFGSKYPEQAHHRGASINAEQSRGKVKETQYSCGEGFMIWFHRNAPNPNMLTGAVVGGPDRNDKFEDLRSASSYTEPTTYINTPLVGVLAKLYQATKA